MPDLYVHHRIDCAPRQWQTVSDTLRDAGAARLAAQGGVLYGIWRSQIGTPRDELNVITAWPDGSGAPESDRILLADIAGIRAATNAAMIPTLRPERIEPPRRQGNFAFRWFDTPKAHWAEFLDLCAGAWPGFESAYDSQIIGMWRFLDRDDGQDPDELRRTLLMTRRPDLAMWERSKIPDSPGEAEVRRKLSRRYDLCDWTSVFTTTLLTADDRADNVRWA
ncbi:MAG: hypothetical protein WD767_02495 [Alphaproteobacteria bacterium]